MPSSGLKIADAIKSLKYQCLQGVEVVVASTFQISHFVNEFFFIQLNDLKLNLDGLEKERDFYFGKLRDIEVIVQENNGDVEALGDKILQILYATEVGTARAKVPVFAIPVVEQIKKSYVDLSMSKTVEIFSGPFREFFFGIEGKT